MFLCSKKVCLKFSSSYCTVIHIPLSLQGSRLVWFCLPIFPLASALSFSPAYSPPRGSEPGRKEYLQSTRLVRPKPRKMKKGFCDSRERLQGYVKYDENAL